MEGFASGGVHFLHGWTEEVIFAPQAEYTRRLLSDVPDLRGSLRT
ncbi:hypothetical protein Y09_1110 [Brachybacterium sp. SW0106-09]|nr:hypothetical protein Y09_1110 [Brachybacterium sp. SW0106-09]